MSTGGKDDIASHNNGNKQKADPAVQFNPISLSSDDESGEEGCGSAAKSDFQSTIEAKKISLNEKAIQECFLLAVKSHDNIDGFQEAWHWDEDERTLKRDAAIKGAKEEEKLLEGWVPRPMFLPMWAIAGNSEAGVSSRGNTAALHKETA